MRPPPAHGPHLPRACSGDVRRSNRRPVARDRPRLSSRRAPARRRAIGRFRSPGPRSPARGAAGSGTPPLPRPAGPGDAAAGCNPASTPPSAARSDSGCGPDCRRIPCAGRHDRRTAAMSRISAASDLTWLLERRAAAGAGSTWRADRGDVAERLDHRCACGVQDPEHASSHHNASIIPRYRSGRDRSWPQVHGRSPEA